MTTATTDKLIVTLANGLSVKGSYQMAVTGTLIDLYVVGTDGLVIASRNFGIAKCEDSTAALKRLVLALAELLTRYKIDTLTETRIIERAVPVVVKAFRKDIALQYAA